MAPDNGKKYTLKKLQRGPTMKLLFSVLRYKFDRSDFWTETININDMVNVMFVLKGFNYYLNIGMKIIKNKLAKTPLVPIKIICEEYQGHFAATDDWIETHIKNKTHDFALAQHKDVHQQAAVLLFTFEVNITIQSVPSTSISSMVTNQLYEDEEFTDVLLQGTDGNVSVHKTILLAHSDMFKTMIRSKEWAETKEGCIKIEGANVKTLQHLKDYLYLDRVPNEGLEPLLLIASCYLMDKLKTDSISQLVKTLKPADIEGLVKFACENDIPELIKAILFRTSDDVITSAYLMNFEKDKIAIK